MKQQINELIQKALQELNIDSVEFTVEYPPSQDKGDYACNVAMKLASQLKKNPLEIASDIKDKINSEIIDRVEVAPPGFLNFYLKPEYLTSQVKEVLKKKSKYGGEKKKQEKIQFEFISANPTGPTHMGNGRGGFTGDVLAKLYKKLGYQVKTEYYLNDRGNQLDTLTESVIRRYMQLDDVKLDYPEDLYQGDYVKDLAKKIKIDVIDKKTREKIRETVLKEMIALIKEITGDKAGIKFDKFFSEKSLYKGERREKVWNFLKKAGLIYEQDKAWWFKATQFGDDKDRVIIKSDGEPTYFFSDILYLQERLGERKFDKVVMIWGCDHHGDLARVQAAAEVLGFKGKLDIILYQLVRLMLNGKEVRMSKRKGNYIVLDELIEEVGLDAVRFFFLMYSLDKTMDFDLNLAKKKSSDNPVYYVQYAHARISSILKKIPNSKLLITNYSHDAELGLIKELIKYPDLLAEISQSYEVHHLPNYAIELARKFHNFYDKCQVIEDDKVNESRAALLKATQIVLQDALELMGVNAPEKM